MKGVVFLAVKASIEELLDDGAWDRIVAATGAIGDYDAGLSYPDDELRKIVSEASSIASLTVHEFLVAGGRASLKHLVARVPELVTGCSHPFDLLRVVDDVIHVEVLRLYPDARPPKFDWENLEDGTFRVTYRSARRLDALAEGLILGVGDHFGVPLEVSRVPVDGDPDPSATVFDVVTAPVPASATS